MRNLPIILSIFTSSMAHAQIKPEEMIQGNWIGIDMYQDSDSYDGKNFFLPNGEFMIIEKDKIKIYFYPYSKSDEFMVDLTNRQISYKIGGKTIEANYNFTNLNYDTLIFTMHFIDKSFVKLYSRATSINERPQIDFGTVQELDRYGFNPSSISHLFELDTFHTELYHGFTSLDSLGFKPYRYLQFLNDKELLIDQNIMASIERGYKSIKFERNGFHEEFKVFHSEGTQSFSIIPVSHCSCENIIIPYLTVAWADRIREDMRKNYHKYR